MTHGPGRLSLPVFGHDDAAKLLDFGYCSVDVGDVGIAFPALVEHFPCIESGADGGSSHIGGLLSSPDAVESCLFELMDVRHGSLVFSGFSGSLAKLVESGGAERIENATQFSSGRSALASCENGDPFVGFPSKSFQQIEVLGSAIVAFGLELMEPLQQHLLFLRIDGHWDLRSRSRYVSRSDTMASHSVPDGPWPLLRSVTSHLSTRLRNLLSRVWRWSRRSTWFPSATSRRISSGVLGVMWSSSTVVVGNGSPGASAEAAECCGIEIVENVAELFSPWTSRFPATDHGKPVANTSMETVEQIEVLGSAVVSVDFSGTSEYPFQFFSFACVHSSSPWSMVAWLLTGRWRSIGTSDTRGPASCLRSFSHVARRLACHRSSMERRVGDPAQEGPHLYIGRRTSCRSLPLPSLICSSGESRS